MPCYDGDVAPSGANAPDRCYDSDAAVSANLMGYDGGEHPRQCYDGETQTEASIISFATLNCLSQRTLAYSRRLA